MALWLDSGVESPSSEAKADLDAINALRETAAIELKEKGNEYMKMGEAHYKDAVDCYTRAINQKSMDTINTAILYANRAQAHLLLGNYRYTLSDAQQAVKLDKANIKAYFRGSKAALSLHLLNDAAHLCSMGLEQNPGNKELEKLKENIDKKTLEAASHERLEATAATNARALAAAITSRNIKFGRAVYKEHTEGKKPWLDSGKFLHWPVLFLYAEFMISDFIEDFCEVDSFAVHLETIFSDDSLPLPCDMQHNYTHDNINIFYQASAGPCLSEMQLSQYLLDGTEDFDLDDSEQDVGKPWIKVPQRLTLHTVLAKKDFVVPGLPVFYIVSKSSSFYSNFVSGRWSPP